MHSARRIVGSSVSASAKPGRETIASSAVLGDRRVQRVALGAVAEELAAQALDPLCGERDRGDAERRASRGSAGRRTARAGRPARGGAGSSAPAYRPRRTVTAPRSPSSRRRAAWSSEKQNARWGTRAQRRWTSAPTRPPSAAEVVAPVGAAPDLEPVDDQPVARERPHAARPRAARSTGRRRCARRRSGGRGAAGARARPAPNTSGGRIRRRPPAV